MPHDDATLFRMAQKLRRHSILSTTEAGSGHPTTCMSAADLVSALFFDEMRFDPRDPSGHDADVFVLSKGHAAPILWAALSEAGAIGDDLLTLRRYDSVLEGHPTPRSPWVRVATGSLGQGLSTSAKGASGRTASRPRRMSSDFDVPNRFASATAAASSSSGIVMVIVFTPRAYVVIVSCTR